MVYMCLTRKLNPFMTRMSMKSLMVQFRKSGGGGGGGGGGRNRLLGLQVQKALSLNRQIRLWGGGGGGGQ